MPLRRNGNRTNPNSNSNRPSESDPLLPSSSSSHIHDRFSYHPPTFFHRLASGTIFRSRLRTSEIITVPYSKCCKYFLVVSLLISGILFSPDYIPKWLGFFDWRSNHFCPPSHVNTTRVAIETAAQVQRLSALTRKHQREAQCFRDAATAYYGSEAWRNTDTSGGSQCTLTSNEGMQVCVGPTSIRTCDKIPSLNRMVGAVVGLCRTVSLPRKCRGTTELNRAQQLLELERERADKAIFGQIKNKFDSLTESDTNTNIEPSHISFDATTVLSDRGGEAAQHVMAESDFASNAYIVYSALATVVGTPLVLYKRGRTTRVIDLLFGMRKSVFVALVVGLLSLRDIIMAANIDLKGFAARAWNDPCGTLDPHVAATRAHTILGVCSNITAMAWNCSRAVNDMDDTYFRVRRYAICAQPGATYRHPMENDMRDVTARFRYGDLQFHGLCNVSALLKASSDITQDEQELDKGFLKKQMMILLLSGVVAQVFIKVVFSSWILHVVALIDPMVVHGGRIELWDASTTGRDDGSVGQRVQPLNERELKAARSFARDAHILPVIFLTIAVIAQCTLIGLGTTVKTLFPEAFKSIGEEGVENGVMRGIMNISNNIGERQIADEQQCVIPYT